MIIKLKSYISQVNKMQLIVDQMQLEKKLNYENTTIL